MLQLQMTQTICTWRAVPNYTSSSCRRWRG